MGKTYYLSDTHFLHTNIIKYCGRTQFMNSIELEQYKEIMKIEDKDERQIATRKMDISQESTNKMDETIISRWNQRVTDEDTVIFLGDFCWAYNKSKRPQYFIDRLNGNIIFIKGNHDKGNRLNTKIESMRLREKNWLIWATHNPRHIRFDVKINFCGHVHEKWKFVRVDQRAGLGDFGEPKVNTTKAEPNGYTITDVVNLSVDVWDYYPREIGEIKKAYYQWRNEYEKT